MKLNRVTVSVAVLALPLFAGATAGAVAAGVDTSTSATLECQLSDDGQPEDSGQARRLWRARAGHESRRLETARRLEAQQARERESARLQGAVSGLSRRESHLRHEVHWTRREFDSISRDPADLSAMARHGSAAREFGYLRNELELAIAARQRGMKQLDGLRFGQR